MRQRRDRGTSIQDGDEATMGGGDDNGPDTSEQENTTRFTITSTSKQSAISLYFNITTDVQQQQQGNRYVYVQFVLHDCWKETEQTYVTRVITRRLTIAKDMAFHLKSMDPQTTAVALVKRAVLLGRSGGQVNPATWEEGVLQHQDYYDTRTDDENDEDDENDDRDDGEDTGNGFLSLAPSSAEEYDEYEEREEKRTKQQVQRMVHLLDQALLALAQWFYRSSTNANNSSSSTTSKVTTFTHELMEVARTVYDTRRYLTNSVGRHADELSYFVHALLATNVAASERIISPSLYGVRAAAIMQHRQDNAHSSTAGTKGSEGSGLSSVLAVMKPVPLSTLAMSSDMLLLLHSSSEVHVWSGGLVAGVEYDPVRQELIDEMKRTLLLSSTGGVDANKVVSHAGGSPRIVVSYENDSIARSLYARLEPSHMDNEFLNLKYLSRLLGTLTKSKLAALRSKMLPSDELTFHSYVASLFKKE